MASNSLRPEDPASVAGRLHPRALSFKHMIAKVQQAEDALEAHERQAAADWRQMKRSWRAAWTAPRIVLAGLASGFAVGITRPLGTASKVGGATQILHLVSAVAGLFAGGQAQAAADQAEEAAARSGGMGAPMPPIDEHTERIAEAVGT
ncbi:MAG TPA: hypothetical protein VEY50_12500 [Lysobacter sp.]|nr:hypothetical protein [Lysobacter sp.]